MAVPSLQLLAFGRTRPSPAPLAATAEGVTPVLPATAPTVALHCGERRYLFGGVGEGMQRLAGEHRFRLSRAQHIFLACSRWHHVAGLSGALMTLADASVSGVSLFGPQNLTRLIASMRYFLNRTNMRVDIREVVEAEPVTVHQDAIVSVRAVPLALSTRSEAEAVRAEAARQAADEITTLMFADRPDVTSSQTVSANEKRKRVRTLERESIEEAAPVDALDNTLPLLDETALVYIVQLADIPGRVDKERLARLRIPAGPYIGRLKAGETVTLDDGRTIQPADVAEPAMLGEIVLMVTCPSLEYVARLAASTAFDELRPATARSLTLVHMSPPHVLAAARYVAWTNSFGARARHVFCDESMEYIVDLHEGRTPRWRHHLNGSSLNHELLRFVQPQLFAPLPLCPSSAELRGALLRSEMLRTWPLVSTVPLRLYNQLYLRRRTPQTEQREHEAAVALINSGSKQLVLDVLGLVTTRPVSDSGTELEQQLAELTGRADFAAALEQYRAACAAYAVQPEVYDEGGWRVTFLGTGSSIPSKYRNVSSTMVHMGEDAALRTLLFDCGEGTCSQLLRIVGDDAEARRELFGRLRCVFVSHMHADHQTGLLELMLMRSSYTSEPLDVVGPRQLGQFLHEVGLIEPLPPHRFTDNIAVSHDAPPDLLEALGLARVVAVTVPHTSSSFGFVLHRHDGFRLVFSGDTRPSDNLVNAGTGADVLIHEATLEDGLEKEAKAKRHCTMGEAVAAASRMNARHVLLTHFSQRYPKAPAVLASTSASASAATAAAWDRCGLAADLMQVTARTMPLLVRMKPLLPFLFPAEDPSD